MQYVVRCMTCDAYMYTYMCMHLYMLAFSDENDCVRDQIGNRLGGFRTELFGMISHHALKS